MAARKASLSAGALEQPRLQLQYPTALDLPAGATRTAPSEELPSSPRENDCGIGIRIDRRAFRRLRRTRNPEDPEDQEDPKAGAEERQTAFFEHLAFIRGRGDPAAGEADSSAPPEDDDADAVNRRWVAEMLLRLGGERPVTVQDMLELSASTRQGSSTTIKDPQRHHPSSAGEPAGARALESALDGNRKEREVVSLEEEEQEAEKAGAEVEEDEEEEDVTPEKRQFCYAERAARWTVDADRPLAEAEADYDYAALLQKQDHVGNHSRFLSSYASPPYIPPTPGRPSTPGSRAGFRKSDPVARGQAMRGCWGRDAFLRNSSSRKFDLRPDRPQWGAGAGAPPRRPPYASPQNLRSGYVPPHEKRRDALRLTTRLRMNGPAV